MEKFHRFSFNQIKNNTTVNDTLKFSYIGDNISNVITYNRGVKSKAWFFFNSAGNVDSIVTKYGNLTFSSPINYSYTLNESSKKRKKEVFMNFDNTENPLKNLIIFDETFFRAISKNNFKSYREYFYDENNLQTGYSERDWNFVYENNKIDFAK